MPYENEHACRLHPPGDYDKFARKNCEIKHEGKCIDVIYGIKEGKSEIQAMRYPKKVWDAEDARAHCEDHDGTFEAAAKGEIMMATRKIFNLKDLKFDDAAGTVRALFAPFNVVDKQGDLTLPGAFGQQNIIIGAYGHRSWDDGLPVGKGRIFDDGEIGGVMEGAFFLDTAAGLETYKTVKNVGDLQEWSYSLPGIESEMRTIDGETVRILKKITVNEVSPVLRGAGNGTRTLDIKDGKPTQTLDHIELVTGDVRAVVEKLSHVTDLRTADGRGPGAERVKRATELEQALEQLARELARLKAVGSDEPTEIEVAMLVELTRFTLMSTAQRR
ncbi:MAG TPA: HK97 family phage prohead protease [Candidatus Paceibacterota bacterium]|nr:HK97 family phage prohead protease [Candidatus Paceibacterota bacterium]